MKLTAFSSLAVLGFCSSIQAASLNLDLEHITVSGISSGGYMANQFHLAHSDWVKGAAIFAAGPYFCAQDSIATALSQCVNKSDDGLDLASLNQTIEDYQHQQWIKPLSHLADSKVWLFHGELDNRIIAPVTDALHAQYQQWLTADNLHYVNDQAVAHLMPTIDYGVPCDKSDAPYLGNCDYDAAGQFLSFLYADLAAPDQQVSGSIRRIDQQQLGGEHAKSLADEGYLFVPKACANGQSCQLHISFHGCNQNAETIEQQYVKYNGLNRWADDNKLVVLYPQTKSSMMMPLNPQGCWDWWGYTDSYYATAKGQQIQAVEKIARALTQSQNN